MDKSIIKIVSLLVALIVIIALIIVLLLNGLNLGMFSVVSLSGISEKRQQVENAKATLESQKAQYETNLTSLANVKKDFQSQKEKYEALSDDTIGIIKEATKEEEYFIEYLWITLGNYATAHNLEVAIVEPNGTTNKDTTQKTTSGTTTDTSKTDNKTSANSNSDSSTNKSDATSESEKTTSITDGLSSSASDLTVQIKGSYIDLADFVFEVENDKSLRFKLDNIKMKSAGGTSVIASFNVKDFTVLKSLTK